MSTSDDLERAVRASLRVGTVAAGDGIEHEQRLAAVTRHLLRPAHQQSSQRAPPGPAVHEHLREVRAVRLIVPLLEQQLHGSAHPLRVVRDEQRASDATPSAIARQKTSARERGSGCMTLTDAPPSTQSQQDVAQRLQAHVVDRMQAS